MYMYTCMYIHIYRYILLGNVGCISYDLSVPYPVGDVPGIPLIYFHWYDHTPMMFLKVPLILWMEDTLPSTLWYTYIKKKNDGTSPCSGKSHINGSFSVVMFVCHRNSDTVCEFTIGYHLVMRTSQPSKPAYLRLVKPFRIPIAEMSELKADFTKIWNSGISSRWGRSPRIIFVMESFVEIYFGIAV